MNHTCFTGVAFVDSAVLSMFEVCGLLWRHFLGEGNLLLVYEHVMYSGKMFLGLIFIIIYNFFYVNAIMDL